MSKKQKNKNNNNNGENNNNQGEKEEEKDQTPTTVVLKVDMHCDGCASKIVRCVRGFQGVESLTVDGDKLTVTGNVDPVKLRDKLAGKTKKKVDLISPLPNKKDKENQNQNQNQKKQEDKKPKELPVTTAVLKVALHCQGCIERIKKITLKTKGVYEVAIDKDNETVTVKGTMDVKAVIGNLTEKLKRKVEVVPPKKEKEGKDGGAEKGDGSGGNKKKQKGGGGGGEDNKDEEGGGGKGKTEQKQNKMVDLAPVYGYGPYGYGLYSYSDGDGYYMAQLHAPQFFSDENPNACSVM